VKRSTTEDAEDTETTINAEHAEHAEIEVDAAPRSGDVRQRRSEM
jgi:hypothetical protein